MHPPNTAVIIDDQEDIRFLIRHIIEYSGGDLTVVGEAPDGQSGLDVLHGLDDGVPTVVVIDWMMPGLNGIETSAAIKAERPDTRIILCSAFADPQLRQEALDAGIDMVMSKEQIGEIPERIRALLGT